MSRLEIPTPIRAQVVVEGLYRDLERRIESSPPGLCPVDMTRAFLEMCHTQSCGKCVPCRVGLWQLKNLLTDVLNGEATMQTLDEMMELATSIMESADCPIGYEAAHMVYKSLLGCREDYEEHIRQGRCTCQYTQPVPCVSLCPAHVDIPGYIALVKTGRYADAIRLIRKDNPFPTTCGFICEHPCEARCRRNIVDDAVNIRGLKRVAADFAGEVPPPVCSPSTGKRIAVVGGGPVGLSAAYFLQLMGHQTHVFEMLPKLGGMLRYGIPDYRLPQEVLERDIEHILTTGINVITDVSIGRDVTMEDIQKSYDAVYISIGAHNDKKIGIEGEDAENVVSAVSLLRRIDEGNAPDFTGKRICVIGGGNVSMDATRTAKRLGAESVTCVYRRRVDDMTALAEEIEEAMAEGCQILPLQAPARIEKDAEGKVAALWTVPQIIGPYGKDGRPKPIPADVPEFRIACDYVIVAIGQAIDARPFEAIGIKTFKGMIQAEDTSSVADVDNVFAGGDAVSGPATVIRAVAAGKVAAANIDAYLGFEHKIKTDVVVPPAHLTNAPPCGRVNLKSHCTPDCKGNFDLVVEGMSRKEADQESERCLRCDYFGFGSFRGGRTGEW